MHARTHTHTACAPHPWQSQGQHNAGLARTVSFLQLKRRSLGRRMQSLATTFPGGLIAEAPMRTHLQHSKGHTASGVGHRPACKHATPDVVRITRQCVQSTLNIWKHYTIANYFVTILEKNTLLFFYSGRQCCPCANDNRHCSDTDQVYSKPSDSVYEAEACWVPPSFQSVHFDI